jgi:hypothetical protein
LLTCDEFADYDREEVQQGGEDAMSLFSSDFSLYAYTLSFLAFLPTALHNASGHRVPAGQAHETNTPPVKDTNVQNMILEERRWHDNCE